MLLSDSIAKETMARDPATTTRLYGHRALFPMMAPQLQDLKPDMAPNTSQMNFKFSFKLFQPDIITMSPKQGSFKMLVDFKRRQLGPGMGCLVMCFQILSVAGEKHMPPNHGTDCSLCPPQPIHSFTLPSTPQ